jgi:hypothetical protein
VSCLGQCILYLGSILGHRYEPSLCACQWGWRCLTEQLHIWHSHGAWLLPKKHSVVQLHIIPSHGWYQVPVGIVEVLGFTTGFLRPKASNTGLR